MPVTIEEPPAMNYSQQEALWQRYDSAARSLIATLSRKVTRPVLLGRGLLISGELSADGEDRIDWSKWTLLSVEQLDELSQDLLKALAASTRFTSRPDS